MSELKSKFDENYKKVVSDQKLGKPKPAVQKSYPEDAELHWQGIQIVFPCNHVQHHEYLM